LSEHREMPATEVTLEHPIAYAATNRDRVSGLTHSFYRYPARFPPQLISELINRFTSPGDLVVDPFVGGGTTAVESRALGRKFVGNDLNALAAFVSRVKSTPLGSKDLEVVEDWLSRVEDTLRLGRAAPRPSGDVNQFRNMNCRRTWPIRNAILMAIDSIGGMGSNQEKFIRCILLNSAQRALDGQKEVPSVAEFRARVASVGADMVSDMRKYSSIVSEADASWACEGSPRSTILNRSTIGLESVPYLSEGPSPKLVVTSPPYPGVHVLYHRWQIQGRRETPLPYWIANVLDGAGLSYYTFGGRHLQSLPNYFANALRCFESIASLCDDRTVVAQVVGFNQPGWQLDEYLNTMREAGLREIFLADVCNAEDGRLWRDVPNRKWFNQIKGRSGHASVEVVLFHRKA
jgi:hypothetical protein